LNLFFEKTLAAQLNLKNLFSAQGLVRVGSWSKRSFRAAARRTAPYIAAAAHRTDFSLLYAGAALAAWLAGAKEATAFNLGKAVGKRPFSPALQIFHARSLKWQGRQWMQLEALEQNASRFKSSFFYLMNLGKVRLEMNRLEEARQAFEQAIVLRRHHAKAWWYLGQVLDRLNKSDESEHAYTQVEALSWRPMVRRYGVGVLFEQAGQWNKAASAYELRAARQSHQAGLYLRCARAFEHLLDWPQAALFYQRALDVRPDWVRASHALAWVQARRQLWAQAAQACRQVLKGRSASLPVYFDTQWLLAFSLSQQQQYQEAARHFAKAHLLIIRSWSLRPAFMPCRNAERSHAEQCNSLLIQARLAFQQKNWKLAESSLALLTDRWPEHVPRLFISLAEAYEQTGHHQQACEAFLKARFYRWPQNYAEQRYSRKKAQRQVMEYTEYLDTLSVRSNVVLYESYAGVSISCNPYAIYQAIVDAPEFAGWTHVWVLNDLQRIPADCAGRPNVVFVARDSQLYQRYLATAEWLINNSTFPSYFIRREEQRYLNTWHGTPLKTLGKDIRSNFMEHKNTARNLLHATHVLSPNPHTSWVLMERYDIDGLYQGQLAQTGYPRNDLVIKATAQQKAGFRQKLGLQETGKPLVLYAPTWRGILGHPEVDSQQLIADLQALQQQDCQIVFRGHYFAEKALAAAGLDNVHIAPQAVDTSELLAITDVLITDYSSIFFDYLPTGRPILFYTYDLEQYQQERGLYFGMDEMPGANCATLEQLGAELGRTLQHLAEGAWQPDASYRAAQLKFSPSDDGQATRRAVEFFFKSDSEIAIAPKRDGRKTLLFFAGPFAPMGITTAAINLISALDPERYRVVVAIDSGSVGGHPERIERLSRLPKHVRIIGRVGRQVCSAQERATIDRFHRHDEMGSGQWTVYETAFQREFRRMFGSWQPDHVINYDGYARFWAGLFACGPAPHVQRLIYLHNDMHGEWRMKFPHLAGMFALYSNYDRLISVAQTISETNRANLAQRFHIQPQKFMHADNMPDFAGVQAKAQEPLDEDLGEWLRPVPSGQAFVCIGRFSPEKNHSLLLQAFATLVEAYPQARLVILGDGPLRVALETQIQQLNLGRNVLLPGLRANPFPLLSYCDCFVLPSWHEGQPMVLLEALALGKSIIASNIPGVRELLEPGYGQLVELTADGFGKALLQQIENKNAPLKKMNLNLHKENILGRFDEILCKD
jgi:CDP-glycerol glycerophosphotransferase